ncbi:MAG: PH domain-containing protein [Hymenobacteraceae bacterium]|nr:PH domain-containing protein [Hymenobacteraceae bacterium]MDX5395581.1 PH domain-containing protein [Hymenobacteraceae bacterium]MDX5511633.1 PH domain-containing protein [Hymenobacteraceae bacterium]
MDYKASLDPLSKGISAGVIVLFAVIGFFTIQQLVQALHTDSSSWAYIISLVLLVSILGVTFCISPRGYILTRNRLIIKRIFSDRLIFVKDIKQARLLQPDEMKGTIRTFGSGGLFGYFGKFYNNHLGIFTAYMTQRKNKILIRLYSGEDIIVTPDDMYFLEDLQKQLQPRPELI